MAKIEPALEGLVKLLRVGSSKHANRLYDESIIDSVDASLYYSGDMKADAAPVGQGKFTLKQIDSPAGEGNDKYVFRHMV